jgi:hypothetical protein
MTRPSLRIFDPIASTDLPNATPVDLAKVVQYAIVICDECGPEDALRRILVLPPYHMGGPAEPR